MTIPLSHSFQADGKVTAFTLFIPSRVPAAGAERSVSQPELAAGGKIFALGQNALVVVDVVLPTMLRLVCIRKPSIDAGSDKLEGLGDTFVVRHLGDLLRVN